MKIKDVFTESQIKEAIELVESGYCILTGKRLKFFENIIQDYNRLKIETNISENAVDLINKILDGFYGNKSSFDENLWNYKG